MYTSYIAIILLSVCMDYISLTWLYPIPHVMKGITASDYYSTERVCSDASACVELHIVVSQYLNHRKIVTTTWSLSAQLLLRPSVVFVKPNSSPSTLYLAIPLIL